MLKWQWLGQRDIRELFLLQKQIYQRRANEKDEDDVLLVAEHPCVYTYDQRHMYDTSLRDPKAFWRLIEKEHIEIVAVDRGGDLTYHGPGQLVAYCIFDITKQQHKASPIGPETIVEEILKRALADYGVTALPHCDEAPRCPHTAARGSWAEIEGERRKLASCGFRIWKRPRYITTFGFALNVTTDLSYFDPIYPCGLRGIRMTSMKECIPNPPALPALAERIAHHASMVLEETKTA